MEQERVNYTPAIRAHQQNLAWHFTTGRLTIIVRASLHCLHERHTTPTPFNVQERASQAKGPGHRQREHGNRLGHNAYAPEMAGRVH